MPTQLAGSAVVLAGGRSSRMGQPKAMLQFGDATLIERIVTTLHRAFDEVVIVAAPESVDKMRLNFAEVSIVRDQAPFEGPVPALALGLDAISHEAAFACSCDLPMLNIEMATLLVSMLPGYDAAIPEIGGIAQPLHAAYARGSAQALRSMAARGEQRLTSFANFARVRRVGEDELRPFDRELRSFVNVNTPDDYARALRLAGFA